MDVYEKRGHTVYELVRSAEKAKDKSYYKFFDLAHPKNMPDLHGIDVLIHSAYFFDTTNKKYSLINIKGTQQLFEQAKFASCQIFYFYFFFIIA